MMQPEPGRKYSGNLSGTTQGAPCYNKQQVSIVITLDIESMSRAKRNFHKMIELCQRTVNLR